MEKVLFILGRPGTGKSTAGEVIQEQAEERNISVESIIDYTILVHMFNNDIEHKRFVPNDIDFDVIDLSVYPEILREQERQAYASQAQLVILEVATDDYRNVLSEFHREFLDRADFLFLDANVDLCLERIHRRVALSKGQPSMSDEKFKHVFGKNYRDYMLADFQKALCLTDDRFTFIDSEVDKECFLRQVCVYLESKKFFQLPSYVLSLA